MATLAYCFMPDHFHGVLRIDGESNLIDIIRLFKGRSVNAVRDLGYSGRILQSSFYDHLIRPNEDPEKYVRYVLANPVRAGLVDFVDEYPFVGTFEYEVETLEELFW